MFTNDDGTYEIEAVKGNNSIAHDKSVPADKLESLLGKELATKILEDTKNHKHVEGDENLLKTYRGKDLRVGGSGMKGFYGSPTEGSNLLCIQYVTRRSDFHYGIPIRNTSTEEE